MPWVYGGNWDGRRAQDLPAIMCSVIEQINKRWEVLGLSEWVDEDSIPYPQFYDKNGDLLDPLTYPVAADYDGLPVSSTVFQDNYEVAENAVRFNGEIETYNALTEKHTIYSKLDGGWTFDIGDGDGVLPKRTFRYVKTDEEDTEDNTLPGDAVPWEGGDLPELRGIAQINQNNQLVVTATGGYFTLTHNGNTTQLINHNAGANIVQDQLERLDSVGYGNVLVAKDGGTYTIAWIGAFAGLEQDDPTVNTSLLTGGSATISRNIEAWVGLIRPAGNSVIAWERLRDYIDELTIVRFGYGGEDYSTITALGWRVNNTVSPFPTITQVGVWQESAQDALWEGSSVPTPAWFEGSGDEVSESISGLSDYEVVSSTGPSYAYYYTLAYRSAWTNGSFPNHVPLTVRIGAVVQIESGDPLSYAGGSTLRTVVRYNTNGATAYDLSVSINGIDQGVLTDDTQVQIIEYDDPESVEGIPETFTVGNTETPEASPLDGPTHKVARFSFAGYRDMSAEF